MLQALAPFLPSIASAFSGILGYQGQEDTNAANAQQAQSQMDFQERMSNTSYQRATADMKAAGLNPMLAYSQGGAGTPGGAMATMQNAAASGVASASQTAQSQAQMQQVRSNTHLQESQATLNAASTAETMARTTTHGYSAQQLEQIVERLRYENREGIGTWAGRLMGEQYSRARNEREGEDYVRHRSVGGFITPAIAEALARARSYGASATLDELGITHARNMERAEHSGFKRDVSPYLNDFGRILGSGAQAGRIYRGGFR